MNAFNYPKQFAEVRLGKNGSFASFLDYEKVEDRLAPSFLCK